MTNRLKYFFWEKNKALLFVFSLLLLTVSLFMELREEFLIYSFTALQLSVLSFWGYWVVISLFGFGRPRQQKQHGPEKRFLILIPAHNEERVIGSLIQNLKKQEYPEHLYTVTVIADNCSDSTASISRSLGVTVIEHTYLPGEKRGKPYAIKYALDYFGRDLTREFDGVAFFDADNLVSTNYLKEMNDHLCNGDRLIQCYLDTKNPNDTWVTLSFATSYYYMNRSWQLAKSRLGLGNTVGGTGFCVETYLIRQIGWTATSLTEDLEFTMQCLLRGVLTKWNHHSRVYDEKPEGFITSCVQRLRWARGHWDVCFKYALPLLWKSIRDLDIRAFDGFLYLINPGKIILATLIGLVVSIKWLIPLYWAQSFIPIWIWLILVSFNVFYMIYSVKIDAMRKITMFKAIPSFFLISYSFIPLFIWAAFTTENKKWVRTEHTRNIAMEEVALALEEK
ncbi:cellulose synthase/poly-beta-1,6-N-acetylglucosamine synthase-like glycosyltransferase [Fictibacillus halophilus]|uniref:Cellulose synthase/poly-beta-1,6-N-acetylglucosamine synthase-like glycosyltransferase n=1 Tax=Fictibacillus halophilus TaxID=1610490 RepID=A0ABV2LEH1_9BACL|nr:glycosyltransferase family 2 protein [Fictibacillus halophilus]